ncbi:MAG: zinc ribbon domain-containing protein [Actinomycetota bacterium]|nr:zinc ribbon domain-containing protein [Actinomycetota bacterium]
MTINKFCQSCSMPMSKDPQKEGTEKDGLKSDKYHSYYY